MFKFRHKERFECPAEVAFDVTTSEFAGLEKYIPNITKIDTLAREEREDGTARLMLKFHGDGAIPVIARAVVKPEMLRWKQELICNKTDMTIDWKIEAAHFSEHVHCGGKTVYKDSNGGCDMTIDGYLDITLKHLPGLPDQFVIKAVRIVEPFIGKFISPNLADFYKAIRKRMKDKGQLR